MTHCSVGLSTTKPNVTCTGVQKDFNFTKDASDVHNDIENKWTDASRNAWKENNTSNKSTVNSVLKIWENPMFRIHAELFPNSDKTR